MYMTDLFTLAVSGLITTLINNVRNNQFLAILGASGSGKSSLVRAGLIWNLLKKTGSSRRIPHVEIMTPGTNPIGELAYIFEALLSSKYKTSADTKRHFKIPSIQRHLTSPKKINLIVQKCLEITKANYFVLVIDQFEEIFTLCENEKVRLSFLELLLNDLDKIENFRIVITLRADFYHHCSDYPILTKLLPKNQIYIAPIAIDDLKNIVVKPAEIYGLQIQPGLTEILIKDLEVKKSLEGLLPLLSHALMETWKNKESSTLTINGYEKSGGINKAITKTADHLFNYELNDDEKFIGKRILIRLTSLGEGTQDTRRRVRLKELLSFEEQGIVISTLSKLIQSRLITVSNDYAEVTHEALIREWNILRNWLNEDRDGLKLHRRLIISASHWAENYDQDDLWGGDKLNTIYSWFTYNPDLINTIERQFIYFSRINSFNSNLSNLIDKLRNNILNSSAIDEYKFAKNRILSRVVEDIVKLFFSKQAILIRCQEHISCYILSSFPADLSNESKNISLETFQKISHQMSWETGSIICTSQKYITLDYQ